METRSTLNKQTWIDKNSNDGGSYSPNFCIAHVHARKYLFLQLKNKRP